MVGVAVRHHHRLQTGDAAGPQIGREHPRPGVVVLAIGRTGVVEQAALGGLDQHCHALTDIECGQPQLIGARRRHRTEQQRQQPCPRPGPTGYRPGRQQHRTGSSPDQHRHHPGRRHTDRRPGTGIARGQRAQQPAGALGGEHQQPAAQRQRQQRQNTARQCQRRDDAGDQRNREGIGQRTDEGNRRKEQDAQRQQRDGGRHLRAAGLGQPGREPDAQPRRTGGKREARRRRPGRDRLEPGTVPDNRRHRGKRQPETGRHRRPRIRHADDGGGGAQDVAGASSAATGQRESGGGEHPAGALRGQAPAGERRVGKGHAHARAPGGVGRAEQRGQRTSGLPAKRRQRDRRPPEPAHGPGTQARQHRDVQTGNAHQVAHTGAVEQFPERTRYRRLIAHHQRNQHPANRLGGPPQRQRHCIAQTCAQALDATARPPARSFEALRRVRRPRTAAHAAAGGDAFLQRAQLGIEEQRILRGQRALQANADAPSLAGGDRGRPG